MRDRRRTSHPRAVAIITVLLVLSVMAVIALALTALGSDNLVRLRTEQKGLVAQYAAEAGAWRGVLEVADGAAPGTLFADEPMDNVEAEYTVTVTRGPDTVNGITVPDGDHYYVDSAGQTRNESSPARRRVGLLLRKGPASGLDIPVFAVTSMKLDGGSYTDTFNSGTGAVVQPYPIGADPGQAHVGTNSTAGGAIDIPAGKVDLDGGSGLGMGNVYIGPGGGPGVVTGTPGTDFNAVVTMSQAKAFDPVSLPFPSGGFSVDVSGVTTLSPDQSYQTVTVKPGGHLYLQNGRYQFKELVVEGGAIVELDVTTVDLLEPTQRVEVYVEDKFEMKSGVGTGIVNPLGRAEKLRFFAAGTAPVTLTDDSGQAYYVCYAPSSDVKVDNGSELYGALLGNKIDLVNGSAVHYDLALKGLDVFGLGGGGGSAGVDVLLFQRF